MKEKESRAFKQSKLQIHNLLIQEKHLKKQLKEIEKIKMELIIILMGGNIND